MAGRVHLSLKAWQKIENGTTRLDLDRLDRISAISEISLFELLQIEDMIPGFVEAQNAIYDEMIADKGEEIAFLRSVLNKTIVDGKIG